MRQSQTHDRFVAITVAGLAIGLAFALGCQPASDRLEVSGTVKLDGTPLSDGSIRFSSVAGNLVSSGAVIRDGQYQIPQEKGLPPGTYRLEITSPDNNAKPIIYRSSPNEPGFPTQPERIPTEYNIDSKHTIDVTADGENRFEFDIASR